MMSHLKDQLLHEWLGGTLGPAETETAKTHLDNCAQCRARVSALQTTWDALADWESPAPAADFASRVLAAVEAEKNRPWLGWGSAGWMRIAAMVVLSTGVGILAGRWSLRENGLPRPGADDAAHALHLDAFQNGSPAGLAEHVLAPPKLQPATTREVNDAPLFQWLGLTSDQRRAIETADPTFGDEASSELAVLRRERARLAELMESPATGDTEINQQLERVITAENVLERRVGQFVLTARRQLPPFQAAQLMRLCADGLRNRAGAHLRPGEGK